MLPALLGGLAACGAATFAGLHCMVPTSQLYGRSFVGLPPGTKKLALTYDDGPNDPCTDQLLDVLSKANANATFFLIGSFVKQRPDIVRRVVAAGHAVGNHTWDHPNLVFCSPSETRRQIGETQKAIQDACGLTPTLFRPPFGGRRPGTFSIAREFTLMPIMWRVTCYDWRATSHDFIERKAHAQIKGGDVILLHDGGHRQFGADRSRTVKATANLLSHYGNRGYEFVSVPQMIGASSKLPVASLR